MLYIDACAAKKACSTNVVLDDKNSAGDVNNDAIFALFVADRFY